MTNNLEDEVHRIVERMENQENQDTTQTPQDGIQDVYVLIVREQEEDQTQIVESTPLVPTQPAPITMQHDSFFSAYVFVCCSLFLLLSTLAFQLYCLFNPPIATITIIPKSQQVTLSGTMQLGRVLNPITISQSQTTPATGKGHQIATAATGALIYFNGSFAPQTVDAGTLYTGSDGVQVMTNTAVTIPAAIPGNPPQFGSATVGATAIHVGTSGNIPAGDITITGNTLQVSNSQFHNGQDERTYTTVTQKDIHSISTVLKTTLAQSITGALQGQLTPQEQLQILPCSPTVSSDHQPGQEATTVKVTVSETCSAVAYSSQELQSKATSFLATQARQKAGAGYSLFGTVQVHVTQASVTSTSHPLVFLSFSASGTWIYGISHTAQEQIKRLIAGKTIQQAETLLSTLPGVEQATIQFTGFGDNTRLPKNIRYLHLTIFVV